MYKRSTNTSLFPSRCHPPPPPPHPKQSPSGFCLASPKNPPFPKLETHGEELPDSPELEFLPFPQETWSVSSPGCPGQASARTHKSGSTELQQLVSHTNRTGRRARMKQASERGLRATDLSYVDVGHSCQSTQPQVPKVIILCCA